MCLAYIANIHYVLTLSWSEVTKKKTKKLYIPSNLIPIYCAKLTKKGGANDRSMSKRRKDKIGKGILVNGAVVCIAVLAISLSLMPGLAAQGDGASVNVTVNAPEYVA